MYADEAAWAADVARVKSIAATMETFRGKVLSSPADLLAVMDLKKSAADVTVKLWAYGEFRQATHTDDRGPLDAYERLLADYGARTSFVDAEMKNLTQGQLAQFQAAEPKLAPYRFLMEDAARMGPHMLGEAQEALLAKLGPDLNSWQPALFQKAFDRTTFPQVTVNGKPMDVYRNFDALMQNPDRTIREQAFNGTYRTFEQIADLVGFALLQEMKTSNEEAKLRGFDTHFSDQLFRRYLSRSQVDNLFGQIEMRRPIYDDYQAWRAAQIQKDYGIVKAAIWDMDMPLKGAELPRFTADEGVRLVNESLSVLGPDYSRELVLLLDPANGRMDIVGGPKRGQEPSARAISATSWTTTRGCWTTWRPWRTSRATPSTTASWPTTAVRSFWRMAPLT